ncbi:MAG TPA: hypothetical protein PKM48_03030 [Parvularculaceae bacterium]|nr:hypothetical protein [Parvularculaceae bacterium]
MGPLPSVLVSSVVRGAEQGDSHGGLYRVDLESGASEQLLDWNDGGINFDGRGADRGLRGIAIIGDAIFIAASDELFVFDRQFKIVASYRNPYLKHCHEIADYRGALYLTSTGFDSVLRFDLARREFNLGIQLRQQDGAYSARLFNPNAQGGAAPSTGFHLNNVHPNEYGVFVSGLRLGALLQVTPKTVSIVAEIPLGTHNARPFKGGVLLNDTEADSLVWWTPDRHVAIPVPHYPESELTFVDVDKTGVARQSFGRGLCQLSDLVFAGGSSPTTVSVYDLAAGRRVKSINLTMDVRNAAHGMAVWPFG